MPLHTRMLIGFTVGILAGLAAHWLGTGADWLELVLTYVTQPVGELFLRALFMLVVPLVFSALVLGVVEIGEPSALGRIGGKTLFFIVAVTSVAVAIGLLMVNVLKPGVGLPADVVQGLMAHTATRTAELVDKHESVSMLSLMLNIVPRNPVAAAASGDLIGLMFFSLLFGAAAAAIQSTGTRSFVAAVQGVYEISLKLIGWVIELAPYAVTALLFTITARLGFDVLTQLVRYVGTVLLALGLHFFLVFPLLLRLVGKVSPLWFLKRAEPAILTAFSTASSSATLPTTLKVAEQALDVPHRVSRFVCTLGATANMNGTALFEGVTVLFLAQFFGVDLSLAQQVMVLFVCVLGAIGAAGVPGGSLPVIATILAIFGIPPEGLGIILGVDRLLDMCRTAVNVTGDLVSAVVIARSEARAEVLQQAA